MSFTERSPRSGGARTGAVAIAGLATVGTFVCVRQGIPGGMLIGVVLAAAATWVCLRLTVPQAAIGLTCLFALMTSWNALSVGPFQAADLALLLATTLIAGLCVRGSVPHLPWWLWVLVWAVVVVPIVHTLFPMMNADYLDNRVRVDALGMAAEIRESNAGNALKWLAALALVPFTVVGSTVLDRRAPAWIASSYGLGAAASGMVALGDHLGVTSVGQRLVGVDYGSRMLGLTVHPNHLGVTCVIALPIAVWLISRGTTQNVVLGAVVLAGSMSGAYLSGSRAGAVASVIALGSSAVLVRRLRARLPVLILAGLVVGLGVLVFSPGTYAEIGTTTRLTGGSDTSSSDAIRAELRDQAWADFSEAPFLGLGFQLLNNAHNIYLQIAASGGFVLLAAFLVFAAGALHAAYRAGNRDQLGMAVFASILVWLLLGGGTNILVNRYLYVPFALAAALTSLANRSESEDSPAADVADAAGRVARPTPQS
jgi:O-antigen ligase